MARKPEEMTRADQIRARRQIEPVKRKPIERTPGESTERAAQTASRVVTRRAVTPVQPSQQATSTGRRPVYISSATPGKEWRLPSVPRFRIGMRIISGLLSIIFLAGVLLMLKNDSFKVNPNGINIRGNFRVSTAEIATRLSSYGTLIIEVEPEVIASAILHDFPDIKDVKVGVSLPANLNVRVEERIPAIVWLNENPQEGEAEKVWIDDEGHSFEVRGVASLPIEVHANILPPAPFAPVSLEKPESQSQKTEDQAEELFTGYDPNVDPRVVKAIQALNQLKPQGTILRYDAKRGLGWTDPQYGWMVYFGRNADNLEIKMAQYKKIAELLLDRNLQPSMISLEYLHAPYYR